MPYGISQSQPDCSTWATVKQETDGSFTTIGCHATKQDAIDQMVVVSLSEEVDPIGQVDRSIRQDSFEPTQGMKEEAQRGLDWREEFNRGGTMVGVARARDIINGRSLSLQTVRRMFSYFARHEIDKQGQGWSPDEDGYPSAGRIAWALWGGDAGRSWATEIVNQHEDREIETELVMPVEIEPEHGLSDSQSALYSSLETIVENFGMFDKGIGANGAHYVEESPFKAEGLVCSNCVFFEGGRACEIVEGDIAPEAICKFWIIQESLLQDGTPSEPIPMEEEPEEEAMLFEARTRDAVVSDAKVIAMPDVVEWVSKPVDETRSIAYSNLEVRAIGEGTTLIGYAAVWDSPSEPLPWIEYVRRGAFTKTLNDGADVRLLIDHEGVPLARTKSGTLRLSEDERGLRTEADLDPTNPDAARIISAMRRGDISQMSFAFRTVKDSWNSERSSRELREVQLFDVSVVTFPAYEETVAELRNSKADVTVPASTPILVRKNQIRIARHR